MNPPKKVKAGYPEKEFKFTGNWIEQNQGYYRAKRNQKKVLIPEYQADDGEVILMTEYSDLGGELEKNSDRKQKGWCR